MGEQETVKELEVEEEKEEWTVVQEDNGIWRTAWRLVDEEEGDG